MYYWNCVFKEGMPLEVEEESSLVQCDSVENSIQKMAGVVYCLEFKVLVHSAYAPSSSRLQSREIGPDQ